MAKMQELGKPIGEIPVKLGNFTLHTEAQLHERQKFINHAILARSGTASILDLVSVGETSIRKFGDPSTSKNLDYFETSMKFRNAERFEQPEMKRNQGLEGIFETQMNQFLLQYVKDFSNKPGDLIKAYQQVLGIYLREIQYYSAYGKNGLGAVQQLISEMVNFGLRGSVMTQLTALQAGEKAKQTSDDTLPQGADQRTINANALDHSQEPLTDQGIKDIDLYDMGTLDQLMVAVIAAQEVGKPYKQNGVVKWISSCRANKPKSDDLMFVDFALRMAPATKGVLYGQKYFDDDGNLLIDGVDGLNSLNVANETLASEANSKPQETLSQELISILMLDPQLFIKFSAMFGQYADQVGGGDMARQVLKQLVRDDEFHALADPGNYAHLLHNSKVDISSLLEFAGNCFKTPIFTVGNKGANSRTTSSTELGIFREMTNALFQLKDPTIPAGEEGITELNKRKYRRNKVFPLSVVATRKISPDGDLKGENIESAQTRAGKHIERFGTHVVGEISKILFSKASGIIGSPDATSEAKQAIVDELLVQLMINTVFVSPDSFMPVENLKKLRKDFGKRVVEVYNLLMADPDVKNKSAMILGTILQYMYRDWDVDEITGVVNCYKTDTVGNSNAAAYTDDRLRIFALNLLLPNMEQHIDYGEEQEKKQQALYPVMRRLVNDVAAKMPVWFGRSGGRELNTGVFTGTDSIELTLMHEWDAIVVMGKPDGENNGDRTYPALYMSHAQTGQRTVGFTNERAASMKGTLDILTQLTSIAYFLPTEMEISDPKTVKKETQVESSKKEAKKTIPLDERQPIKPKQSEEVPEVPTIKIRPHEEFAGIIMESLIKPILDIYAEFTKRKASEVFVNEIEQVTKLGTTAMSQVNQLDPFIKEHTGKQQGHAINIATAKADILKKIRKIMNEEGLRKGLDEQVLKLITEQSDLIKAQASQPAFTSGASVGGMGTSLIMAPATQNEGISLVVKTIAEQSKLNIDTLKNLIQQLRIEYAQVIVDREAFERESSIVLALKERHTSALNWFKKAGRTASAYEGQRQEILKFVQRIAAEQDITIEKLLRQFRDAGLGNLVDWYIATQNPKVQAIQ